MSETADTRLAPAWIVGREVELTRIASFLEALSTGGRVLLIEGEAGIGKTTLWRQAVDLARDRAYHVLTAAPASSEMKLTFAALGDLLEEALDEVISELPTPQRIALEVALLRAKPEGSPPDGRVVAVAFLGVLRVLARERPVLVAVDDFHWLDAPSAGALEFAARRLRSDPIGLVLNRRLGEPAPFALDRGLAETPIDRVEVGPLTLGALHHLIRERLGAAFPRPTLRRIHETAGGNPLFGLELARLLERRDRRFAPGEPLPVPSNLHDLVRERLEALTRETDEPLVVAAALAEPTVELVEAATNDPRALAHLRDAARAQVIELDGSRIGFTHPLLASVLYSKMGERRRRELHRRLARVLPGGEEQARHFALGVSGPSAVAAARLERVASDAATRGAAASAAELLEHAAQLTPGADEAARLRRVVAAADHYADVGDTVRAETLLQDALEQAEPGSQRAHILDRLGLFGFERGYQVAVPLLAEALAEARDEALRAIVERHLAMVLMHSGDLRDAAQHGREAVRLADEIGDALLAVDARVELDACLFQLGEGVPPDLAARAERALETASREHHGIIHPATTCATMLKWADDFDSARRALERVREQLLERQEEGMLVAPLLHLGELECLTGHWDAAERLAAEVDAVILRTGNPSRPPPRAPALYLRALVQALRGQVDEARAASAEGAGLAKQIGDLRHLTRHLGVAGFLELSVGDAGAAYGKLAEAAKVVEGAGYGDPGVFRLNADEIEALIELGDLRTAARRLQRFEEQANRLNRTWALATSGRCRALLLAASGEHSQAVTAAETALEHHLRLDQPFERARTLLVYGAALRRAKQVRRARAMLGEALTVFDGLGARLWAERARAEIGRLGGRIGAAGDLTATERQVAELVAQGMTNKEVARKLVISHRTVEGHLGRIYAKLGVRSRAALVRKLTVKRV